MVLIVFGSVAQSVSGPYPAGGLAAGVPGIPVGPAHVAGLFNERLGIIKPKVLGIVIEVPSESRRLTVL